MSNQTMSKSKNSPQKVTINFSKEKDEETERYSAFPMTHSPILRWQARQPPSSPMPPSLKDRRTYAQNGSNPTQLCFGHDTEASPRNLSTEDSRTSSFSPRNLSTEDTRTSSFSNDRLCPYGRRPGAEKRSSYNKRSLVNVNQEAPALFTAQPTGDDLNVRLKPPNGYGSPQKEQNSLQNKLYRFKPSLSNSFEQTRNHMMRSHNNNFPIFASNPDQESQADSPRKRRLDSKGKMVASMQAFPNDGKMKRQDAEDRGPGDWQEFGNERYRF